MSAPLSDAEKPTLLVAAPLLYHPGCGNGGGVLCFELLRRLAGAARVHLVAFSGGATADAPALEALREFAASVTPVPRPVRRVGGLGSALIQLVTAVPREAADHASAEMRSALARVAAQVRPDVLVLQFAQMAQYVDALPGVPVAIDTQDVYAVSRYREWRLAGGGLLRRLWRGHTWWAWALHERRCFGSAQLLVALSDTDLGVLRAYVPEVPAMLSTAAWDLVARGTAWRSNRAPVALFAGNFGHGPNADGLRWMLDAVWPRVRERLPRAELHLAGIQLPAGLASDPARGVVVRGFVPDLGAALAAANVSIVPYRFGGGIKIKAVESMAHGCPLVTTPIGAEGLGGRDGEHMRIADGAEAFADSLAEVLASTPLQERLSQGGQALVAESFSWAGKVESLLAALRALRPVPGSARLVREVAA